MSKCTVKKSAFFNYKSLTVLLTIAMLDDSVIECRRSLYDSVIQCRVGDDSVILFGPFWGTVCKCVLYLWHLSLRKKLLDSSCTTLEVHS